MSGEQATVNIPKDVMLPIVEAQIAAGVVAALGNTDELIRKLVETAMAVKVDREGNVSGRSYDNYDLVEVLAKKGIHKVVRESLEKWVEERRPEIEAQVKKSLARKESAFAKALVNGLVASTKSSWQVNCTISMPEND